MVEERANHVPINTVPSDVPSNEVLIEPGAASEGGVFGMEASARRRRPEVVVNSRPVRLEMEGETVRLPVEQFTAMVGILLTVTGGSGPGQTLPVPPPAMNEIGNRDTARRGGIEEKKGNLGFVEGVKGAGNDGESRRGRARSPGDNVKEREAGQLGGGARPPRGPILEEVNSSSPQGPIGDGNGRKRENSIGMGPQVENSVVRSRGRVESNSTSAQVKEFRRGMRKLHEEAWRGSGEVVSVWTSPFSTGIMKDEAPPALKEPTFVYDGTADP